MQNLLLHLERVFSKDKRLLAKDGQILKNKIHELVNKNDKELLSLLLSDKSIETHFTYSIDDVKIFDKEKFIRFITSKNFLPDSYTAYKNKVGLTSDTDYVSEIKNVALAWPYKDGVIEGDMKKEDDKRGEIFYNELLAPDDVDRLLEPKGLTNFKKFDPKGSHEVNDFAKDSFGVIRENLIIKGNNLLVLHSLKKVFAGQIKLIYIDPPYNTGSDSFLYNDSFGHSTWLTFMKNRLEVAKDLLSDDGFLFVHISFHEYEYLKVLLDEIFKNNLKSNWVFTMTLLVRHPDRILKADKDFHDVIEYVLVYTKDKDKNKIQKMSVKNGIHEYVYEIKTLKLGKKIKLGERELTVFLPDEYEEIKKEANQKNLKKISIRGSLREANSSGRFYVSTLEPVRKKFPPGTLFRIEDFGDDVRDHRYFYTPESGRKNGGYYQALPSNYSEEKERPYANFFNFVNEYNNVSSEGGVSLRNAKKPESVIKTIFEIGKVSPGDIVLDFNLGSGTTAAVAHKLRIQYIGIEQLDYGQNDSIARLKNVIKGDQSGISSSVGWNGGGSFVYFELKEWNERWVQEIKEAKTITTLMKIWELLKSNAFLSYKADPKKVDDNISDFQKLTLEKQKRFLISLLDKNQLYVNLSEIDDKEYGVSNEDKNLNKLFYIE